MKKEKDSLAVHGFWENCRCYGQERAAGTTPGIGVFLEFDLEAAKDGVSAKS